MKNKIYNKLKVTLLLIVALLGAGAAQVAAQNSTVTPYSRFGYGMLSENANAAQRAMGGVGYAQRSGRTINFMNPASYAAIDTLTFLFDMAVDAKGLNTTEGSMKGKNFTGGLDYVTLQFPITRYGGGAVGLRPYSGVGYNFGNEIVNGHNAREGSGNLSELFLGLSARPFRNFTVGANFGYLFGTLLNDTYIYTDAGNVSLFERVLEIRDFNVTVGAQYEFNLNADNTIGLGVVYSPKMNFHGHAYGLVNYEVNNDVPPDTVGFAKLGGNYQKAETWGAGISWTFEKRIQLEADFTYQPWKKARFGTIEGFDDGNTDGQQFDDRWRAALGFSYMPNPRGSWFKRVNYRLGGYYSNDYVKVGDNSLREYGVSFGLGLPAPSAKTMVNLAFEYRHRQATPSPLVKENYFMVTVGVNVNELWFWRNKIR